VKRFIADRFAQLDEPFALLRSAREAAKS
jgi:hypothetical protein